MKQFDNFPLIEISGPPMERGFQYGEQAKDKINFSIIRDDYIKFLKNNSNDPLFSDHEALSKEIVHSLKIK